MSATALVSVVIPTYNRLPLLRQAVQSVQAQTYPHWELIVVDDGSTDGTQAFLEQIPDPRLRVLPRPHSGVVGAVRNAGAHAARGDCLAFLDSDDLWLPAKLETQLQQMKDAGVAWSYTRYEHVNENRQSIPPRAGTWQALSGDIASQVITADAAVTICTVIVEKRLFFEVGPFVEDAQPFREDYDLVLRLALRAPTLAVPDLLTQVREHQERATKALVGAQPFLATARVYDRILPDLPNAHLKRLARKRRAGLLAEAGAQSLKAGSLRSGARYFLRSFLDRPLSRQWASALARGLGLKR